jgi:hypothetical protein
LDYEARAICLRHARKYTTIESVLAVIDQVITLCDRAAKGEAVSLSEWETARENALKERAIHYWAATVVAVASVRWAATAATAAAVDAAASCDAIDDAAAAAASVADNITSDILDTIEAKCNEKLSGNL